MRLLTTSTLLAAAVLLAACDTIPDTGLAAVWCPPHAACTVQILPARDPAQRGAQ